MAGFRFLHMADVHLETPFQSRKEEERARLRSALLCSFQNAIDLALAEKLDAVLIAGDLFHSPNPSYGTERFLLGELKKLNAASIPVYYATGNHDPGGPRGTVGRIRWPANVTFFSNGEPLRREVKSADGETIAYVTGAGHFQSVERENLAARFPVAKGPLPEIALLHASVEGSHTSESHDRYAPCGTDDLTGKGYDYWALGHIHLGQEVSRNPAAYYSGNILGLHRNEKGEKGALIVEANRDRPAAVRFHATAPLVWDEMDVDVTGAESVEALVRLVAEQISGRSAAAEGTLLTVHLKGPSLLKCEIEGIDDREAFTDGLISETGIESLLVRTAGMTRKVDLDRARVGPIATVLDLVEALREGKESFDSVLPNQLAGIPVTDVPNRDEYLVSLLNGAEEELVYRMLEETE